MSRVLDFDDSFTSASTPTVSGVGYRISGTFAAPNLITAAGGITTGSFSAEIIFVAGSGGPINITKDPQIKAGVSTGDALIIYGTDNTNTLTLDDGTGLSLNGSMTLFNKSTIQLIWDGLLWVELSRKD